MAFISGIVSVTFRKLSPVELIALVKQAGLEAIEWGADVHVPTGDLANARHVGNLTRDAELKVISYGAYYRAGQAPESWAQIVAAAEALGAPNIRIWAGPKGSADTNPEERAAIVADLRRVAGYAAEHKIAVSLEYHGNTLTDTPESAHRLFEEVSHPNLFSYWQPAVMPTPNERDAALQLMLPLVSHVHVFHWVFRGTVDRLPLAQGQADWARYLKRLSGSGRDHGVLMEFVRNDSRDQFLEDAVTLKQWLSAY